MLRNVRLCVSKSPFNVFIEVMNDWQSLCATGSPRADAIESVSHHPFQTYFALSPNIQLYLIHAIDSEATISGIEFAAECWIATEIS